MVSADSSHSSNLFLLTGGSGFIGLHVARHLKARGNAKIRIADIAPLPGPIEDFCHEFLLCDLRDRHLCNVAVRGVQAVLHFAANTRGLDHITEQDSIAMHADNHVISMNVVQASLQENVSSFLYASSGHGCDDPLNCDPLASGLIQESTKRGTGIGRLSQDLYNLEKQTTEAILQVLSDRMDVRIARLSNVYGPGGTAQYNAVASMLRQICASKQHFPDIMSSLGSQGDTGEKVNLLYIDDAVDAILKLLAAGLPSGMTLEIAAHTDIPLFKPPQVSLRLNTALNPSTVDPSCGSDALQLQADASPILDSSEGHRQVDWVPSTPLEVGLSKTLAWIQDQASNQITLDVVIPCYRVNIHILETILALRSSSSCKVTFIIIIDDPVSPSILPLKEKYSHRPDVRVLVNESNIGASASRNRGLRESAADWVHFLDDDIIPQADLLLKAEQSIRAHPLAAGFVGTTSFPRATNIFTTAVLLTGMLYLWDIADGKLDSDEDMPWGVTANLIVRRSVPGDIEFDLVYPKTGGGEDIHFCREQRDASLRHGGEAFFAAPEVRVIHPWWKDGTRSYWRFYNLSFGDGALIKRFPAYAYRDFAPNSAEFALLCALGALIFTATGHRAFVVLSLEILVSVFFANILHACYQNLMQYRDGSAELNSSLRGSNWHAPDWIIAVIESSLILMFSECGRLHGVLKRREFGSLGNRFDWFAGRIGSGYSSQDRKRSVQKLLISLFVFCVLNMSW